MTLFDLSDRVAIVTGGNGGIGLGMARGLAAAGARIVVAARDPAKSEKALTELGPDSCFIPLDAADESSCRGSCEISGSGYVAPVTVRVSCRRQCGPTCCSDGRDRTIGSIAWAHH